MTELAYLADSEAAYVRSFRAKVVALPPGGLVLDRTFFYPAGGGQPADRGTVTADGGPAWTVTDVTKSGLAVIHRVGRSGGAKTLTVGAEVEGSVDWVRRHRHMRLHTAQHLLSARVFARDGLRTRKAAMSGTGATIDLEAEWPATETIAELSQDLVAFLAPGRPVRIRHVPRAEFERSPTARSGLVPLAPQVDPVRLVEIDAADACPCGGTHVRSTGEIGPVHLAEPTPIPGGGSRLSFTLDADAPPTPAG
jgi:misacylated tRNA(Ala) deacylase